MGNKLYHLNPNGYGSEFFVIAYIKSEALKLIVQSGEYDSDMFKDSTPDSLPFKYTLDEYPAGKVVRSEIA